MKVNAVPVWISGMGAISCAGVNPATLWENTKKKQTGIKNGLGAIEPSSILELRNQFQSSEEIPLLLSQVALIQAMRDAGWEKLEPTDGIIFATTTGHVSTWDEALMEYFRNVENKEKFEGAFRHERLGLMLDKICDFLQFEGPRFLITTACSASTHALGLAKLWIESGRVKRCLVGGTEILSRLTIEGFRSFQLLSEKQSKPFDSERSGINLSEGSAFVCLETAPLKKRARLSGFGMSTDAYHMTAPHPEGKGSYQAMQLALKDAGILPKELSWIHAHGTGSVHNDLAECTAVETLLKGATVPVTSTKAVHGHALAATGVMEAVLCVKALEEQTLLPTAGLEKLDPLIRVPILKDFQKTEVRHILKNTLGFGGANGAIVLSHPETCP